MWLEHYLLTEKQYKPCERELGSSKYGFFELNLTELWNTSQFLFSSGASRRFAPPTPAKRSESTFFFTREGPNESILLLDHVMDFRRAKWG